MKLSELKLGQIATVLSVSDKESIKNRLQCFGITDGVKIRLIRRAPLGGPLEIKVRGFYLALRKSVADKISVKL